MGIDTDRIQISVSRVLDFCCDTDLNDLKYKYKTNRSYSNSRLDIYSVYLEVSIFLSIVLG